MEARPVLLLHPPHQEGPEAPAAPIFPRLWRGSRPHHLQPPSAAPSVYHTPFKFLPPSDPRRQAQLSSLLRGSTGLAPTAAPTNSTTPTEREIPALGENHQVPVPKFNVTREQVAEMRALRAADPTKWSVVRLAEKFECSKLFVMICCKASAEHQARERERKEAIKARWGPIRSQAREDRKKRRTLLLRGEL
ncbi:60S ribosomal protein [Apiospora hydei]|uniref:60S ribosomal protein n=1 Tax=Apiospora hydei TaxID=1337664 RepID=A0ABR1WMS7_9PEZI